MPRHQITPQARILCDCLDLVKGMRRMRYTLRGVESAEGSQMPETKSVAVRELSVDLRNYRTVPQPDQAAAVEAMISARPDRFWALTESLLEDGYLPTESIIVVRGAGEGKILTVREGNRRVAAMKLIHGILPLDGLLVPENIVVRIGELTADWRRDNQKLPCTIYEESDAATVDRIVRLAHGKGERVGRDQWNALARARHNRDRNRASEPALDLLEKFLKCGRNVTAEQSARWAGAFPLSVLAEAMKRVARRLGVRSSAALAGQYPAVAHWDVVERVAHDIGMEILGFEGIRDKDRDFGESYGLPPLTKTKREDQAGRATDSEAARTRTSRRRATNTLVQKALATGDPRAVKRLLRDLAPRGRGREKVESLRIEALRLDLKKTPLAFCFVIRSMFELSAKAYCQDHVTDGGPSTSRKDGKDRPLADVLRDITNHLTNGAADKEKVKALHGAMTELGRSQGLLSVTSMNQLIHNPRFSVIPSDIAVTFANVFPLLEEMNE